MNYLGILTIDLFAALLIIFVTTCDLDCYLYNQNKKDRKRLILESQYVGFLKFLKIYSLYHSTILL